MKASLIIFLTLAIVLAGAQQAQQKPNPKNAPKVVADAKKQVAAQKPAVVPAKNNAPKVVPGKAPAVSKTSSKSSSSPVVNQKSLKGPGPVRGPAPVKGPGMSDLMAYIQSIISKLPKTPQMTKMASVLGTFGNVAKGLHSGLMTLGATATSNISQCAMMANQTFHERAVKLYMVISMTSPCAAKEIVEKVACKFNQNLTMCMSGAFMKLNETLTEKGSLIPPKFMMYLDSFHMAVQTCTNMTNATSADMMTCFGNVVTTFAGIIDEVMMMLTNMPNMDLSMVFMPFRMCVGSLMEMSGKGMEMLGRMFEMLAK